ncbi:MAG: DUF2203 domain-containing protein [Gemmatimonadaceae bacterium]
MPESPPRGAIGTADPNWTPERANKALPLIRRIVDDLVEHYATWQDLVSRFEVASLRSTAQRTDPEAERLAREVQRAARDIQGFVAELTSLGVEVKSMETGLLDFPGERDGRLVYYCWQRGEPRVSHWHEIDAGIGGRQAL